MTQPQDKVNPIVSVDLAVAEPPKFVEPRGGEGLILFGEDNLYPDYLIDLYTKSPKHGAIINHKVRYSVSGGWAIKKIGKSLTQIAGFNYLIAQKNKRGQNLNKIASKIGLDFEIFNGFAFEPIWKKNGKNLEGIYHVPFALLRAYVKDKVLKYCYLPDWTNVRSYDTAKSKPGFKEYDLFGAGNGNDEIVYYKECRPVKSGESDAYPIPYYIQAIPYIECDAEVASYCVNGITNEFWGSQMITFTNGTPATDELKRQITSKFEKHKTGTKVARRVLINFVDSAEQKPIIDKLTQENIGEQFTVLNDQIREEIFTIHGVTDPALFGLSKGDALISSNPDRMQSYALLDTTVIQPRQDAIETEFNEFFNAVGLTPDLYLQKVKPVGIQFSEATIKEILSADDLKELIYNQVGLTPKADKISTSLSKTETDDERINYFETNAIELTSDDILGSFRVEVGLTGLPDNTDAGFLSLYMADVFSGTITDLEAQIISIISSQPDIPIELLAEGLDITVGEATKAVNKLIGMKILKGNIGENLELTPAGENNIRKSDKPLNVEVRYTYTDEGAPAVETESRSFCKRMMALAATGKTWTRKQIDAMQNSNGQSAWIYRGGFYHNPNTDETTPFCRHHWKAIIVKRRG